MSETVTVRITSPALLHLDRALSQFEDFCTVSQSVRAGIPIEVTVTDAQGRRVK